MHDTCRGINQKIQMNQMSGVILKPTEHDALMAAVTAYFNDTLPSVANQFAITQEEIVKLFMVSGVSLIC